MPATPNDGSPDSISVNVETLLTETPPRSEVGVCWKQGVRFTCVPYSQVVDETVELKTLPAYLPAGTVRIDFLKLGIGSGGPTAEMVRGIEVILPEDQPASPKWAKDRGYRYLGEVKKELRP